MPSKMSKANNNLVVRIPNCSTPREPPKRESMLFTPNQVVLESPAISPITLRCLNVPVEASALNKSKDSLTGDRSWSFKSNTSVTGSSDTTSSWESLLNKTICIETYLKEYGIEHLWPIFIKNQISLKQLAEMKEPDFVRMEITNRNDLRKLKKICYDLNNTHVSF